MRRAIARWALAACLAPAAPLAAAEPLRLVPLGAAAFDEARREGRPLLVIVRDPACARCVLDEEEALADVRAAPLLRSAFVVARVDRFERPDLDQLFATAVHWLAGERGYPLVLALLPDGRPYAARAAIGAEDRGETPGLHRFALRAWSDFTHARPQAESRAAATAEALARAQRMEPAVAAPAAALHAFALRGLRDAFDARLGGFGPGEAFAPAAALRLLLTTLEHGEDAAVRRMLERTLDAVAATEPAPDTLARRALLLEAFARATQLSDSALYRARAAALADGALDLRDADGAFAAYGGGAAPVVAGWNGLMIGALALSGRSLDRPQDLAAARTAAEVVLRRLGPAARLRRSADAAGAPLEDHAYLAEGLLRLHAALAGREPRWAEEAAALVDAAMGRYLDAAGGGFFDAVAGRDTFVPAALPQRLRSGYDRELPSANGVMAAVLARLARALAQPRYAELSRQSVEAFSGDMRRAPRGMEGLAAAVAEGRQATAPGGPPERPAPASDVRDGIAFAAELTPEVQQPGQPFLLRVRIAVPRGRYVVAHDPGASDLVGLSVSLPTAAVALSGPVRYPVGRRLRGRWDSGTVSVHDGVTVVEVPLRLSAGGSAATAALRLRVLFQACRDEAATCERPQTVLLEAPVRIAP